MPVLVIRLHPDKPTSGANFTSYLTGLKIEVSERSFGDPDGRAAGSVLGSAHYDPADPAATVVQHLDTLPFAGPAPAATAAVVVAAPPAVPEYLGPNLALTVTRTVGGVPTPIVVKDLNYDVDLDAGPLPVLADPVLYAALGPTALYLALPPSPAGLPVGTAVVDLPTDGSAPSFTAVQKAVEAVLAKDPGAAHPVDITALTPAQCRHIAREIVFNRTLNPLPQPPQPLESLYRDVGSDDTARRQFEGDLVSYYAVHGTEADTLAKYVHGVSTALACAAKSHAAAQVGLAVPVFPGLSSSAGTSAAIPVVVSQ
ncbi:hypothetical protein ACFW1A_03455 [Kitasatospora sp. NPDC058965]|uniref:hypothetical protein n=1 Tax=Kitasatospora sp. NPDC058965 TaxID=3346682 RepID=UPI0036C7C159